MNRAERRRADRRGDAIVADTGMIQAVPANRMNADPAARAEPGEHMWVLLAVHRITRPQDAFDRTVDKYLDMETLLTITGPGCFLCEAPYEPGAETTVCPGETADVPD